MKPIILYYSKSGTTEKLVKKIQKDLDCPAIPVEPEKAYGSYISAVVRSSKELLTHEVPGVKTPVPDLKGYDPVLVGYPVWMSKPPVFFTNFLSKCDLKGKTVIPFSTAIKDSVTATLPALEEALKGSDIRDPYGESKFKKDDYQAWIEKVRQVIS